MSKYYGFLLLDIAAPTPRFAINTDGYNGSIHPYPKQLAMASTYLMQDTYTDYGQQKIVASYFVSTEVTKDGAFKLAKKYFERITR